MTETPQQRRTGLVGGLTLMAAFGLITWPVVAKTDWLSRLDSWFGTDPQRWTADHAWLEHLMIGVQWITDLWPMTAYTILAAVLLWVKNHRRAALFVVGVMVSSTLIRVGIRALVAKDRPVWDDPVEVLHSYTYPSGHATGIAAAATVAIVLIVMLVRRRGLRRLLSALAVLVALLVGADRILLGVHNLSDVVAGWVFGTAVGLLWLWIYNPTPVSTARTTEALPEVFPSERRTVAVVLNPVKVDDPGGFKTMVETLATESGWATVSWHETTVEDPGVGQAHAAAVAGADLVIACGGDGTVRAVCEELAGTGIPVGIVPAGTGNLLARNLNIPLYLRSAVDAALNGQDRAIDMVETSGDAMEDQTFLVMAGMGFDAAIMEGVNEQIKARVGWIAYVLSALKSLMFPAVRIEVSIDDGEFTRHRARTVVIGNVGHLQGGMPLIPDAEIDDGLLDVVLLHPRRFLSWLPLAVRVLSRSSRSDELVNRMRGRTVTVRASTVTPRQLDGDLIESGKELTATVVHGRLLVRVPR